MRAREIKDWPASRHCPASFKGLPRRGLKPGLHPLLAVLAEARLVAQLWLRPGNAPCGSNARAFFPDLWGNLPRHLRLRGVRTDSGFCLPEPLALWKQLRLPCVVVAQMSQPIQNLFLVTSLPARSHSPLAVWRYYNGRADGEKVIKELQSGFALGTLCRASFWATEAALSLAPLTYNLTSVLQRQLGWQTMVTIHSVRFRLFVTAGVVSLAAGKRPSNSPCQTAK